MTTETKIEHQNAFEAMFQHANIGLIISNDQGVIEQVNIYAERLFGYGEGELVGQKVEVLIPAMLRTRHEGHREGFSRNPGPRAMGMGMDLRAAKKDGTEFPVEISLAHYTLDGKRHVVSFVNDITLRKKIEDELKNLNRELEKKVAERTKDLTQALMELNHINASLSEEMEYRKATEASVRRSLEREKELSELKSRFVSMASHEFRTPLGGILTSASLIARYDKPEDAAKREKHVSTIKTAVTNLTGILNDFLSLDKLETGKIECHPESFPLDEFIDETIESLQTSLKKGQHVVFTRSESPVPVCADRNMLRNVLLNLLSNASKYSAEGCEILLTTEETDEGWVVNVRDFGLGIPEEEQKHLFERFFRAKNAATIQGTGLGLNIVKKYLDLMGGSIRFVSEHGIGTTFTVILSRHFRSDTENDR